jgi:putative chitinase
MTSIILSIDKLKLIMPRSKEKADIYFKYLIMTMERYEIAGILRESAFIAQIAHESGELNFVKEIWGNTKYQKLYEYKKSLGNTQKGDGKRFLGRGLIQLTGRSNYEKYSYYEFNDNRLISNPEILETPQYACLSAGWYWHSRKINEPSDDKDFREVTKRINAKLLNYKARWQAYTKSMEILK